MYILLQHFQSESKAHIKAFGDISDIEKYMCSECKRNDCYTDIKNMHGQLIDIPNYEGVIGYINNDESKGIIYNLDVDDDISGCFVVLNFHIDNSGNYIPWIKLFAQYYEGKDYIVSDIIDTNYLQTKYKYFKEHIIYLKFY